MNTSVSLEIKGKTFTINYPTIGQYYAIEVLKQQLAAGFYSVLLGSRTSASYYALDMIDIQATLTVLAPDFIKELKVNSFNELGIADYTLIRDAYREKVVPLFKEINEMLRVVEPPTEEGNE